MNFNTARDIAHLSAFSHAMAARDEMNNRPVSLADFGGARMFGDTDWAAAIPGLITAGTQGAAAIITAIDPPTTVNVTTQPQTQYSQINPATGRPYGYPSSGGLDDNMMLYIALGGVALVALMFLSKKSAPKTA